MVPFMPAPCCSAQRVLRDTLIGKINSGQKLRATSHKNGTGNERELVQLDVNEYEFRFLHVARSLQRDTADVNGNALGNHGESANQWSVRRVLKDSQ